MSTLGCSGFGYGTPSRPVRSAMATEVKATGVHAGVEQTGTRVLVRASHLCDLSRREERTAGAAAERYHPQAGLDASRREKEHDTAHLGPLTESILRGVDDSGMQQRSITGELHRGLSSPWLLGAVAGGVTELVLVATSRVEGRIVGEHQEEHGVKLGIPCAAHPFEDATVELLFQGDVRVLGRTDDGGVLSFDLADALSELAFTGDDSPAASVMVEGRWVGEVMLAPVAVELARRDVSACRALPGRCRMVAER